MNALDFLRTLWPEPVPGYLITVAAPYFKGRPYALDNLDAAAAAIEDQARATDVYVIAGLQAEAITEGRGKSENVVAFPGFSFDFDFGPHHTQKALPATLDEVLTFVHELPCRPTILLFTGHGALGLWLHPEPSTFETDEDRETARKLSGAFGDWIRRRAAARGWLFDSTQDLVRAIRVPGTFNRKVRGEPVEVRVLESTGRRYRPYELYGYAMSEPAPASTAPSAPSSASSSSWSPPTNGHRKPIADILGRYAREAAGGRNVATFDGFAQVRDCGWTLAEALAYAPTWHAQIAHLGKDAFPLREAEATIRSVFKAPAREPHGYPAGGATSPPVGATVLESSKTDPGDFTGDCGDALAETRRQLAGALAEAKRERERADAAEAERAALKAERRTMIELVRNPGIGDRELRVHLELAFNLPARQSHTPEHLVRFPSKWIESNLRMGRAPVAAALTDAAERGLILRQKENEVRDVVDKKTGEIKTKGGTVYYHGVPEGVDTAGDYLHRVHVSYIERPRESNHGGPRWDGKTRDPKHCGHCGEDAVENHTYGTCRNCGRRYKDGVPIGGVRTPVGPFDEIPEPLTYQVDTLTPDTDRPEGVDPPHADKVLVRDQVDTSTPPPANGNGHSNGGNGNAHQDHRDLLGRTWADWTPEERAAFDARMAARDGPAAPAQRPLFGGGGSP